MILSLLFLLIGLVAYSISQLQQHNKLSWQDPNNNYFGFWGKNSWVRKYKNDGIHSAIFTNSDYKSFYYRFFKIKYKEKFPLSATFLVAFTDGMHMCQSIFFLFISLSFSIATSLNFFLIWGGVLLAHFVTYKVLQR